MSATPYCSFTGPPLLFESANLRAREQPRVDHYTSISGTSSVDRTGGWVSSSSSTNKSTSAGTGWAGAGFMNGAAGGRAGLVGERTTSTTTKIAWHLGHRIGLRLKSKNAVLQLRQRRFSPSSALAIGFNPSENQKRTSAPRRTIRPMCTDVVDETRADLHSI